MARSGGNPGSGMIQRELLAIFENEPYSVQFFQAVHALEQIFPEREPVGEYGEPSREVVRFNTNPTLNFPASEVHAYNPPNTANQGGPPRLTVNMFGTAGVLGPLPNVYTSFLMERLRARDHTLHDFLDLFHHRLISLFYLAWEKYRIAVTYRKPEKDKFTHYLMDLAGIGTKGLQKRQAIHDHSLIYYAGLLGLQSRPAVALEQMLRDHFGVKVEVKQLVGGWYELDEAALCRLDDRESAARQLGEGAVAGDAIWDHQARVRIRVGPLTLPMYRRFLPGGSACEELRALVKFFSGGQFDFELQLVLARDEVPEYEIGAEGDDALPLGLCSWAGTGTFEKDPDDAVLLLAE
jgi:type VI secretion system protein ImpH